MQIGDLVIFKDKVNLFHENTIKGGIVLAIGLTTVVLQRHNRPPTVYLLDEVRPIKAEDLEKPGIEVI